MDALYALLLASLSSNKGRAIRLTYMAKPCESIMVLGDKRNAFHAAYTKTIEAETVLPLTETKVGWPLVVDMDFRFPLDVEDRIHTSDIVEIISKKFSDILGEYV